MTRAALDHATLKHLSRRNNAASVWRLAVHVGAWLATGTAVASLTLSGHWWAWLLAMPVLMLHGCVTTFFGYAGMGHELHHGTVFSSQALNRALFQVVSFLTWNNPVYFRASHSIHHRHTLEAGKDHEVNPAPYPLLEQWWRYAFVDWAALQRAFHIYKDNTTDHVRGPFGEQAFRRGTPARSALVRTARWHVSIHCGLAVAALAVGFWPWVLLVTLAPFICTWPNRVLAKLQHSRCERVDDYRHNSRTVLLPAWLALFYWNMNYHIEHHMYPAVPYCKLPALREALLSQLPHTEAGLRPHWDSLRMPNTPPRTRPLNHERA